MEECEALCQRVGIMVGGRMRCVGSIQHLKNRFGRGFQTEIKLDDASEGLKQAIGDSIRANLNGASIIKRSQLGLICSALGIPDRVHQLNEKGAGWAIDAAFEKSELPVKNLPPRSGERAIPIPDFAAWWAAEDAVWNLFTYITTEAFPGAALLERQGPQLRFQLPPQRDPLGVMFHKIESAAERLCIQSYALGQTTLEQIFNTFARDQQEEKGTARGFAAEAQDTAAPPVVAPAGHPGRISLHPVATSAHVNTIGSPTDFTTPVPV
jgi:ATP-binding cassette subfamily A (ABC1) protein 3